MMGEATGRGAPATTQRWRQLCAIADQLAQREGCLARPVWDAAAWLDAGPRLRRHEIVVAWTPGEAALIRRELREWLDPNRVFAAAPRVRYHQPPAERAADIPGPRGHEHPQH